MGIAVTSAIKLCNMKRLPFSSLHVLTGHVISMNDDFIRAKSRVSDRSVAIRANQGTLYNIPPQCPPM